MVPKLELKLEFPLLPGEKNQPEWLLVAVGPLRKPEPHKLNKIGKQKKATRDSVKPNQTCTFLFGQTNKTFCDISCHDGKDSE